MTSLMLLFVFILFKENHNFTYQKSQCLNIIQSLTFPGREPNPAELCERLETSHAGLKLVSNHSFCSKSLLQLCIASNRTQRKDTSKSLRYIYCIGPKSERCLIGQSKVMVTTTAMIFP